MFCILHANCAPGSTPIPLSYPLPSPNGSQTNRDCRRINVISDATVLWLCPPPLPPPPQFKKHTRPLRVLYRPVSFSEIGRTGRGVENVMTMMMTSDAPLPVFWAKLYELMVRLERFEIVIHGAWERSLDLFWEIGSSSNCHS